MGCTDEPREKDVLADMPWYISKRSGMIQLNPLLPLDVVYKTEHGSGVVGKAWDEHHQAFAELISSYDVNNVLEIGGLHGILANKINKIAPSTNWTIIEPNPIDPENIKAKVIRGFFDDGFIPRDKYDCIVHSHVLEHTYDPRRFMEHTSELIEGGILIFSVPNMDEMIKRKYTNCINFEHTVFLGETHIEYLLSSHGFSLINKEYYRDDHSIFYAAIKNHSVEPTRIPTNAYDEYKDLFNRYIDSHLHDVNKINEAINSTDIPVYLFGAHVFSQYLISFGLDPAKIVGLLDNDESKRGKRLYGTSLHSDIPEILKGTSEAIVILRAGVYNDEVRNNFAENINPNVKFI
jgi:hypothetical protein